MKKEKKWPPHIIAASALVVFVVLGLLACATTPGKNPPKVDRDLGVYDSSVPDDQLCTLEIVGGIHVRAFNGVTVGDPPFMLETALAGWGVGGYNANRKGSDALAVIRIPAGTHRLLTSFYIGNAQQHAITRDVLLTHNFVAGHTYRLNAALIGGNATIRIEAWNLNTIPYRAIRSIEFRIDDMTEITSE